MTVRIELDNALNDAGAQMTRLLQRCGLVSASQYNCMKSILKEVIETYLTAQAQRPRVYLDLDGVMADFDAHFPATFGLSHKSLADDAMWTTINSHPSYFRDMPPCAGAVDFFRSIEAVNPIILTACPKSNYAHAATQKRAWVRQHLSETVTVLPVMGGSNKPLFMHRPSDILIDDFSRNIDVWERAGGVGILHRDFAATTIALANATLGRAAT